MRCRRCGSAKIVIDRSLNGRPACSACGSTDLKMGSYESNEYNESGRMISILLMLLFSSVGLILLFQSRPNSLKFIQDFIKKQYINFSQKAEKIFEEKKQQSDSLVEANKVNTSEKLIIDKPYHYDFERINSPFEVLEYLHYSDLDIQICPQQYTWLDNLAVQNYHEYCKQNWKKLGKVVKRPNLKKIAEDQSLPYIQILAKKCKLNPNQSKDLPMGRPGQSADSTVAFIFQGGLDSIINNKSLQESMLMYSDSSFNKSNICSHLNAPGVRDYIKNSI